MLKLGISSVVSRAWLMLLLAPFTVMTCFSQQTADNKLSKSTIPMPLKQYLSLSSEQAVRLQNALNAYEQLVSSKRDEMHSLQMKAAVDPSVNASRVIESDQAEIQKARCHTREEISAVLSPEQISRLIKLRSDSPSDAEHAKLAAEAAELNLIELPDNTLRQPFGGTTSLFSADTKSQPELPDQQDQKKVRTKRAPPKSPPP